MRKPFDSRDQARCRRQRVLAVLKAREGGTEDKLKTSPLAVLKEKLVKQTHAIADLEERLAAAEARDGDRWKPTDTARDIATTMVGTFSPSKAETIAKEMLALLKKRGEKPTTIPKLSSDEIHAGLEEVFGSTVLEGARINVARPRKRR